MKTLSKSVFLFGVLVLGVVGCKSGGGSDSGPSPTPDPIPVLLPPALTFLAKTPVLENSASLSTSATLEVSWSAQNATLCNASSIVGWSGGKPVSGNEMITGLVPGAHYSLLLVCAGEGGTVSKVVTVDVPSPVVLPPPPPPPSIKASLTCDSPGASLISNPQGFVVLKEKCVFSADKEFTLSEISFLQEGYAGKLLEVIAIEHVQETVGSFLVEKRVERARTLVVDGVGTLVFNSRVGKYWDGVAWSIKKFISFEARFAPLDPLGVSEPSRDMFLRAMAKENIKTVENVVFSNPFPVQVGFARMVKGKLFFTKNNEVFRRDVETGKEQVLTYSYGSSNTLHDDMYVSRDGKQVMFQRRVPYVLDTDGEGCISADIPVVVSLGCNKGLRTIPLALYGSDTSGWATITDGFSPDGTMLAYVRGTQTTPGGSFLDNVYIAKMSSGGIEQITTDQYGGSSVVIGSMGVYFDSCRPDCGIFWTAVDFSTGKPAGEIKLIHVHEDGGLFLMSVSVDEKQFLLQDTYASKIFLVGVDGVFRTIGSGIHPKFVSSGMILWDGHRKGAVLSDADGSNQVFLGANSESGFAFIP